MWKQDSTEKWFLKILEFKINMKNFEIKLTLNESKLKLKF